MTLIKQNEDFFISLFYSSSCTVKAQIKDIFNWQIKGDGMGCGQKTI
jgi:hypothetical protein